MGADEVRGSCLFEIVVRIRRLLCAGIRSWIRSWRSEMLVAAGKGKERVAGRLRPGKEVKKTLTVDEPIVNCSISNPATDVYGWRFIAKLFCLP